MGLQNNRSLSVSENWAGRGGRSSRQVGPEHTARLRITLALSIKALCYEHPHSIVTFVEIMAMDFFLSRAHPIYLLGMTNQQT